MIELTGKEKKRLRGLAHSLQPVVHIGRHGITEAVAAQVEEALDSHELIKVKVQAERAERQATVDALVARTGAGLAGLVGGIAILYRPNPGQVGRKA